MNAVVGLLCPGITTQGATIYAAIVAFGSGPARRQDGKPAYGSDALAVAMADAFVVINGGGEA